MKALLHWLPLALGVTFLVALAYLQKDRALQGANDFAQLYTGATLVNTPDLYLRTANLAVVKENLGFTMESVVYTRPPFYAALLRPLALLPYRTAYLVFSIASLASVLWFVSRFSKECSALPFFAAMSLPILTAICGGQDTPFLLAILGGTMLLTRANKDVWAGVLLSLLAIKFHLFLFVPVLLLLKRRWAILRGAMIGMAGLIGFGILVAGGRAWQQYVAVLRDPWINPSATIMPNIHGLVAVLNGGTALELALIATVVAGFLWTVRSNDDYEFLLAVSLVCGLLVSFHSGVADDIVLLPAFVAIVRTCTVPSLRAASALVLTPVPYFMVLADAPYSAFLPVSLFVVLGLSVVAVGKRSKPVTIADEATSAS
jgi:type IV secretory pathway VirB2 component (pilin)